MLLSLPPVFPSDGFLAFTRRCNRGAPRLLFRPQHRVIHTDRTDRDYYDHRFLTFVVKSRTMLRNIAALWSALQGPHLIFSCYRCGIVAFIGCCVVWAVWIVRLDCQSHRIPWQLTALGSSVAVVGESLLFQHWIHVLWCASIWPFMYAFIAGVGAVALAQHPGLGGADIIVGIACGAWLAPWGVGAVVLAMGYANVMSVVGGVYNVYRRGISEAAHTPAMMAGTVLAGLTVMM